MINAIFEGGPYAGTLLLYSQVANRTTKKRNFVFDFMLMHIIKRDSFYINLSIYVHLSAFL